MAGPSLIATLGANISPFIRDLDTARGRASSAGDGIASAFGGGLAGKLTGLFSAAAIEETIRRTLEYGSKVNDLALRLGISTTAVQEWDYALTQSGSSIEAAAGFFEKLAINRDKALKGSDAQVAAFQKLGITLDQLKNSRIEDIAASIAKAFQGGDPQALIGSLREVGGKGAGELVAAFSDGLAGKLSEALVISPEDIANLDKADDAMKRIGSTLRAMSAAPISAVLSSFEKGLVLAKGGLAVVKDAWENGRIDMGLIWEEQNKYGIQKAADDAAKKPKPGPLGLAETEKEATAARQKEEQMILDAIEEDQKLQEKKAEAQRKAVEASEKQAAKDAKDSMPFKPGELQVNSLQRSGFFVGGLAAAPEIAHLEVAKKSYDQLTAIRKGVERLNAQPMSDADDTQF